MEALEGQLAFADLQTIPQFIELPKSAKVTIYMNLTDSKSQDWTTYIKEMLMSSKNANCKYWQKIFTE
jgi:hypothetical protein